MNVSDSVDKEAVSVALAEKGHLVLNCRLRTRNPVVIQ